MHTGKKFSRIFSAALTAVKVHKHEIIKNFFYLNPNLIWHWLIFENFLILFLRFLLEYFQVTEHTRNQIFLPSNQIFFFKMFTLVLLDGFLHGFSKFWLIIVEFFILIWYFSAIFENYILYSMRNCAWWASVETILSHTESTPNKFPRMLSQR